VDLSESLEDMDIETLIKLHDDRVKEKERKNAERELLLSRKTIETLEKKKKVAERKSKSVQNEKKKQKLKLKDAKKKLKKKKDDGNIQKFKVPNIKDIPANCKEWRCSVCCTGRWLLWS
jgi:hypothetical protein